MRENIRMQKDVKTILYLFIYLLFIHVWKNLRRVKRKRWMQEWLKKREQYSHVLLLNEIRDTEAEDYKNYFRMNDIKFDKLLKLVTPFLLRKVRRSCSRV